MKSIKIILLSFSLAASLAVTSYAMSQSEYNNETTVVPKYSLRDRSKNVKYNLKDNLKKIQLNKNKKNMKINTKKQKNVPIDIYGSLTSYYHKSWKSLLEMQSKKNIQESLQQFKDILYVNYENITTKDMSQISNLKFDSLQSILLDYYNFSVLFNTKYASFLALMKNYMYQDNIIYNKYNNLEKWNKINVIYTRFVNRISNYVNILNDFCYKILFDNDFNKKIQNAYINSIDTKNDKIDALDTDLNEKISKKLSGLTTDLQDVFKHTNTEITKDAPLWANTFKSEQITNNNFINENALIENDISTLVKNFEVTPKIDKDYEVPINLKDQIPSQYKINSYILAAIYKMELLKSTCYMKKLKDNPLKSENTENIFKSYDKAKKYANDIFKTYNSLRCLIAIDKTTSSMNIETGITTLSLNETLENENKFKEILKQYASNNSNSIDDIINLSTRYVEKTTANYEDHEDILNFISKKDFTTKYNINSIPELYLHIVNNAESYKKLFNISNMRELQNFYLEINEKNKNNIVNMDNLKTTNIDFSSDIETNYNNLQYHIQKAEQYLKHLKDIGEEKNKDFIKKYNLYLAQGLLDYYNNNWDLDKDEERRDYIEKYLDDFNFIRLKNKKSNNKENINIFNSNNKENINIFDKDFNSLQSILLEYYKFLLFFSKYNFPITLFTTKTSHFRNYKQFINLIPYKLFKKRYVTFTNSIKEKVKTLKTFVNDMLTENFHYLENKNINDISETTLKDFSTIRKEILKLGPNFRKIFKLMGIDEITDDRILNEDTRLETIDRVPKIDENIKKLNLYFINVAPPHYLVNLDILATILKMEILKWLPYFKKMPNTTVLNDQEKNTDINFTQNKKIMGDYINKIYQFYDKLKSYMVWSSRNKNIFNMKNYCIYSTHAYKDVNILPTIKKIMGKEKDFIKNIQEYIQDDDQLYTTLYFLPKNLESDLPEQSLNSELSKKKLSNIFKIYYDKRHNENRKISPIKSFVYHILDKQEIYNNLMNSNDSDMSDMKLLDKFFSDLDPGYFTILTKKNTNTNNPPLMDNNNLLLKENKDDDKSNVEQLIDAKLQINTNQNSLTYNNNNLNKNSIFQKNYDHYMITDNTKPNIIDINLPGNDIFENNIFKDDSSENDRSLDKNEQQSNQKNLNKPLFFINNNLLLKENKDDNKSNAKQLKETKPETKNLKSESLMYNNDHNDPPIFQKNSNSPITYNINEKNFSIFNSYILDQNNDERQTIQDNLTNSYAKKFKSTTKRRQFNRNAIQINNNALVDPQNNLNPFGLDNLSELPVKEDNNTDMISRGNAMLNSNNARQYEDLTQINQNQQQYIQNIENESEKSFERGIKEKKSKEGKSVLGQKTFRKNDIKKDTPSKKKK